MKLYFLLKHGKYLDFICLNQKHDRKYIFHYFSLLKYFYRLKEQKFFNQSNQALFLYKLLFILALNK